MGRAAVRTESCTVLPPAVPDFNKEIKMAFKIIFQNQQIRRHTNNIKRSKASVFHFVSNPYFFPPERKPVLPYPLLRDSFRPERGGVVLFFYLPQRRLDGVGKLLFLLCILHFKLYEDGVVLFFLGSSITSHLRSRFPCWKSGYICRLNPPSAPAQIHDKNAPVLHRTDFSRYQNS